MKTTLIFEVFIKSRIKCLLTIKTIQVVAVYPKNISLVLHFDKLLFTYAILCARLCEQKKIKKKKCPGVLKKRRRPQKYQRGSQYFLYSLSSDYLSCTAIVSPTSSTYYFHYFLRFSGCSLDCVPNVYSDQINKYARG